jgi:hypothetical protein
VRKGASVVPIVVSVVWSWRRWGRGRGLGLGLGFLFARYTLGMLREACREKSAQEVEVGGSCVPIGFVEVLGWGLMNNDYFS